MAEQPHYLFHPPCVCCDTLQFRHYIDLFFVRARELFVATVEGIQEVMAYRYGLLGLEKGLCELDS